MIYEVTLTAPEIDEVVTVSADSEEAAIQLALNSAIQRMLKEGSATAEVVEAGQP
jgi:hypothetical protein